MKCHDGRVRYVDSGWSPSEWAVIEAAVTCMEKTEPVIRRKRMSEGTDYAPAWRPDPNEEIEGRVVQVDSRESEYGVYPILTLEDEGGTQVAIHCVHSILRREIARRYEPTQIVGAQMKIRYDGKQKTKDGKRDFHNYRVFGGNRGSSYDWGQDLPEDERASAPASGPGGFSAGATAEPPIAPTLPGLGEFDPLPPSDEPSMAEKAESKFGSKAPF